MAPLDELHLLSLIPTLSPRERENRPPSLGHTRDGVCRTSVRKTRGGRRLSPLPEGEGRGEGKRGFHFHRMSHIHRLLSIMDKPVIWTVDDDPDVLRAVERDLRRHYGDRYGGPALAGDVRHRSAKGVTSGVGEGAMAVKLVHQYLVLL